VLHSVLWFTFPVRGRDGAVGVVARLRSVEPRKLFRLLGGSRVSSLFQSVQTDTGNGKAPTYLVKIAGSSRAKLFSAHINTCEYYLWVH
jgi:hypothetical protein